MLKLSVKRKLQAVVTILVLVASVYASVTGPDPGYTNAPGNIGNCTVCHDTNTVNSGSGSVTISGIPAIYNPGQQYTLTVTVQQTNQQKFGFQLTAINSTNARAGTLASLGADTQINPFNGPGSRQYIQHTKAGTNPSNNLNRSS